MLFMLNCTTDLFEVRVWIYIYIFFLLGGGGGRGRGRVSKHDLGYFLAKMVKFEKSRNIKITTSRFILKKERWKS